MKPKFEGPYIIIGLDKDGCSATLENLDNGRQKKAHFTNMMIASYDPKYNRVHEHFDDDLNDLQNM